jgi:hypothetical protein
MGPFDWPRNVFRRLIHRDGCDPTAASMGTPFGISKSGAPVGSRTPNLLIRSQMLYPIELRVLKYSSIPLSRPSILQNERARNVRVIQLWPTEMVRNEANSDSRSALQFPARRFHGVCGVPQAVINTRIRSLKDFTDSQAMETADKRKAETGYFKAASLSA